MMASAGQEAEHFRCLTTLQVLTAFEHVACLAVTAALGGALWACVFDTPSRTFAFCDRLCMLLIARLETYRIIYH